MVLHTRRFSGIETAVPLELLGSSKAGFLEVYMIEKRPIIRHLGI